jgi:uncharacterized DUF497 family protein
MPIRKFEIDPKKAELNWDIHKIHLETAALIFTDPLRIERRDDSEGNIFCEERWQTLGKVDKVLFRLRRFQPCPW